MLDFITKRVKTCEKAYKMLQMKVVKLRRVMKYVSQLTKHFPVPSNPVGVVSS